MTIRNILIKSYWLISTQFGFDPRRFLYSLKGLPRFLGDWRKFRMEYSGKLSLTPCLHDWYEEGGTSRSEYFWQDLLVARMIFEAKPKRHVDVGSRVDGFVAHLASFREVEVFDVRPITTQIPGVIFKQSDLMNPVDEISKREGYCDSLSCLHALEHFGLGRYGDKIDPNGYECGFRNMGRLLRKGGVFYLSVPIGIDRIEFNAQHIFDPRVIVHMAEENSLRLSAITVIWQGGRVEPMTLDEACLVKLANQRYALGIFTFVKYDK